MGCDVDGILCCMDPLLALSAASQLSLQVVDSIWLILRYSPYWAPPVLLVVFWNVWMRYVRAQFIANQPMCLLELRMPQEIYKSPAAMQAVLDGMYISGGETTYFDRMWLGKVRTWYSLEIASMEGQVHFYVWTRASYKRQVERHFYAHYPEVEVVEVPDYANTLNISLATHGIFGNDFVLTQPDPYPIRTYVDYRLDVSATKEEQKIDPLAGVVELLGSMRKGEYMWIQILARPHKAEPDFTFGTLRQSSVVSKAAKEIQKIRSNPEETVVLSDGKVGKMLSKQQLQSIEAISRNTYESHPWDAGIRALYIAQKDSFDVPNIPSMINAFRQFQSPRSNGFKPVRWLAKYDYPWQDYRGVRQAADMMRVLHAYRLRSWFHGPYKFPAFILSSEELATLFHPPGSVVKTPTLGRITSTRSQAPSNLPI